MLRTGKGVPHPRAAFTPGVALRTAENRKHVTYPELRRGGAQRLCILAAEVGGRWNADAHELVRQLVRGSSARALRAAASSAWARRWWGMLSFVVQHAVGGTALSAPLPAALQTSSRPSTTSLALAEPGGPSRLPLR